MIAVRPGDYANGSSSDCLGFTEQTRSFPYELDSARAARHYVTGLLTSVDESLSGDASIVITELAANAVLHARSAFTVTVAWSADEPGRRHQVSLWGSANSLRLLRARLDTWWRIMGVAIRFSTVLGVL